MKRIIYGFAAVFAAGTLLANTAVWTKTDSTAASWDLNVSDWGLSWAFGTNWASGSAPQTGDDVSFTTEPDAGVSKLVSLVANENSSNGNYSIGTLTGLPCYEIILPQAAQLTVTDPSGFYGVFKVADNATHSAQGYNHIQPNTLRLNATTSPVVINRYDDAFDSSIEVQNYGVEAQVLSVEHSGPGAIHKTGPGDLVAKFSQGAEHSVFADAGTLYVKENEETDFSLGHATVSQSASLGVKPAETAIVSSVVAYGGTLNKVGAGDLRVGALSARDANGQYDTGSAANVVVQGGTFGTAAPAVVPSPSTFFTVPRYSFDASVANAFVFDENDNSLIAKWFDARNNGSYATGRAATGGNSTGRLPRFVATAIGEKPAVDFGTFVEFGSQYNGDDTAGYFEFPSDCSISSFFVVCKKNSVDLPCSFFGALYGWNEHFKRGGDSVDCLVNANGWGGGSYWISVADWRVDGVRVDMEKYRLHSDDYHLISFAAGDAPPTQKYLGGNVNLAQYGGLSIAEVIIYDQPLAAGEREAIEAHLMDKWLGKKIPVASESVAIGTLRYPTAGDMVIETGKDLSVGSLEGSGTLVKKGGGRLSIAAQGGISGVDVQEGDLAFAIPSGSSADVQDILESAWFRMDPSDETTLTTNEDGRVTLVADANGGAVTASKSLYYYEHPDDNVGRAVGPTIVAAPNTGLNLLDFGPYQGNDNLNACGMMINHAPDEQSSDDKYWPDSARTYFFQAGIVVVEKTGGGSGGWYQSFLGARAWEKFKSSQGKIINALGDNGGGTWMLDGETCDPTTTDWPEGLHVIAFSYPRSVRDIPINLIGQENDKNRPTSMGGLRYGEVLIFKDELSSSELRAMSLYLKDKWLGTSSEVDTSEGLHEVSVAAGSSCSITGDITIADDSTVTLGAARSGNGTITVNGTVTFGKRVDVSVPDGRGRVPLVTADSLEETDSLSTWTMDGVRFRYSIDGGTLYAECSSPGFTIIIR